MKIPFIPLLKASALILVLHTSGVAHAQTTLSGDHVITGNLVIGTSGTKKELSISGGIVSGSSSSISGYNNAAFNGSTISGDPGDVVENFAAAGSDIGNAPSLSTIRSAALADGSIIASQNSVALSGGTISESYNSVAASLGVVIGTQNGVAIGEGSAVEGNDCIAIGRGNTSHSFACIVVGTYGFAEGDGYEWVENDPVFVVGNGTGDDADPPEVERRNALTVYKNGKIKMERQGDILMGEFGNPE